MGRRVIAACLLFVVAAWAEWLPAPMFTMSMTHTHRGQALSQPIAKHHLALPTPHPCCPGVQPAAPTIPFIELVAASLPCADEHRCCFSQGPPNSLAPARDDRKPSPDVQISQATESQLPPANLRRVSQTGAPATSPPAIFGMILRI